MQSLPKYLWSVGMQAGMALKANIITYYTAKQDWTNMSSNWYIRFKIHSLMNSSKVPFDECVLSIGLLLVKCWSQIKTKNTFK